MLTQALRANLSLPATPDDFFGNPAYLLESLGTKRAGLELAGGSGLVSFPVPVNFRIFGDFGDLSERFPITSPPSPRSPLFF